MTSMTKQYHFHNKKWYSSVTRLMSCHKNIHSCTTDIVQECTVNLDYLNLFILAFISLLRHSGRWIQGFIIKSQKWKVKLGPKWINSIMVLSPASVSPFIKITVSFWGRMQPYKLQAPQKYYKDLHIYILSLSLYFTLCLSFKYMCKHTKVMLSCSAQEVLV